MADRASEIFRTMMRKAYEFAQLMQREKEQPPDQGVCWYCKGSGRAPEGGDCYMCHKRRIP